MMLLSLFFTDLTDSCLFKLTAAAMYSVIYACVCVCVYLWISEQNAVMMQEMREESG